MPTGFVLVGQKTTTTIIIIIIIVLIIINQTISNAPEHGAKPLQGRELCANTASVSASCLSNLRSYEETVHKCSNLVAASIDIHDINNNI